MASDDSMPKLFPNGYLARSVSVKYGALDSQVKVKRYPHLKGQLFDCSYRFKSETVSSLPSTRFKFT